MPVGSAVHTPHVRNQIGSNGGWSTGTSVCPSCYISYSTNLSEDDPGNLIEDDNEEVQVQCSIAGIFFTSYSFFSFEKAYTRFITGVYTIEDDGPYSYRYYTISPWCTPATTPPDWNGAGLYWVTTEPPLVPTDVVDGYTICIRIGTSGAWTCAPAGRFTGGSWNSPWPLGNCTHNP
jgi:hypothetical protein